MGKPRIVDGDTIWIGPTKIRMHGIDAPERKRLAKKQMPRNTTAVRWQPLSWLKLLKNTGSPAKEK